MKGTATTTPHHTLEDFEDLQDRESGSGFADGLGGGSSFTAGSSSTGAGSSGEWLWMYLCSLVVQMYVYHTDTLCVCIHHFPLCGSISFHSALFSPLHPCEPCVLIHQERLLSAAVLEIGHYRKNHLGSLLVSIMTIVESVCLSSVGRALCILCYFVFLHRVREWNLYSHWVEQEVLLCSFTH